MAGQVQFMAESIPQAAQYHKQGKVRALAVTSRERNPALPDIPTVMETGIKNFEVVGFYGFLAPAGTPKDVVNKLSDAFKAVMNQADIRQRMVAQGADPAFLGADDFAKFLTTEKCRAGRRWFKSRGPSSIKGYSGRAEQVHPVGDDAVGAQSQQVLGGPVVVDGVAQAPHARAM
jgi:tripartite-type tricarboxylate transporter receptor subunit TctC